MWVLVKKWFYEFMVIDEGSMYVMNVWFIGYVIVYMNGMLGLGLCIV